MLDERQRSLLRNIAGTIGSLAVRCVRDPIAMGSVSTLSLVLQALLEEEEVDVAAFAAIHRTFSSFPSDDNPDLNELLRGCLDICTLVVEYDHERALGLSSALFSMWNRYKAAGLN